MRLVNSIVPAPVVTEVYIFLYSVLSGMLIAFIYDIFRIKRKVVKTGVFFLYLEDILFWIIAVIVMFVLIYYGNEGEIRGYIYMGAIAGIAIYMLLLSKIVILCSVAVLNFILKAIKFVLFIVAYPIRIVFILILFPIKFFSKYVKKLYKYTKKYAKTAAKAGISKITKGRKIFKKGRKKCV